MGAEKVFEVGFILSVEDKMSRVMEDAVGKAQKNLSALELKATKVGKAVMKIGADMTAVGTKNADVIINLAKSTAEYSDKIWKVSQMVGIGVEEFQKLSYAANSSGISMDDFSMGMVKFNETISDAVSGSQIAGQVFEDLGINLYNQQGNLRKSNEILEDVAGVFSRVEDGIAKADTATFLFGKSGVKMIPMLNSGKEGLKLLGDEAVRMGFVLSDGTIKAGVAFNNSFRLINDQITGLVYLLGSALLLHLVALTQKITSVLGAVVEWVYENLKLVDTIAQITLGLSAYIRVGESIANVIGNIFLITGEFCDAFVSIVEAVRLGKDIFLAAKNSMMLFSIQYYALVVSQKLAAAAQWLFNKSLFGCPVIWIIAAILAIVAVAILLIKNWDKVSAFFVWLWAKIKVIFSKAWEGIKSIFYNNPLIGFVIKHWESLKGFFVQLWDNIKLIFSKAWEGIKSFFYNYTSTGLVIKHWDKITGFFGRLWDAVKSGVSQGWEAIKNLFFNYTPLGILLNHWQDLPQMFSTLWNRVKDVTVGVWDSIGGFFSGLATQFFEWGSHLITSLWDGIKSAFDGVKEKIMSIGRTVANAFKTVLGINSPSTVFMEYGQNITQGLTNGMDGGTPAVEKSSSGLASQVMEGVAQSSVPGSVYNSSAGGGSLNLNYSPNITINGNMSPEEQNDFAKMLRDHADEIMQMFEQWQRNKVRLSFLQ